MNPRDLKVSYRWLSRISMLLLPLTGDVPSLGSFKPYRLEIPIFLEGLITEPPARLLILKSFLANPLTPGRDVPGGSLLTKLNFTCCYSGTWANKGKSCYNDWLAQFKVYGWGVTGTFGLLNMGSSRYSLVSSAPCFCLSRDPESVPSPVTIPRVSMDLRVKPHTGFIMGEVAATREWLSAGNKWIVVPTVSSSVTK